MISTVLYPTKERGITATNISTIINLYNIFIFINVTGGKYAFFGSSVAPVDYYLNCKFFPLPFRQNACNHFLSRLPHKMQDSGEIF